MAAMPSCFSAIAPCCSLFMHGLPSRFSPQLAPSFCKYWAAAAPLTPSPVFYGKKERLFSVLVSGWRVGRELGALHCFDSWFGFQQWQKLCVMASVDGATSSLTSLPEKRNDETEFWEQVQSHQKNAARLSNADDARTIIDGSLNAILCTISQDLEVNCKCTLLFMKDPSDRSDTIIRLLGEAVFIEEEEKRHVHECYLRKHPQSFWVGFDDFRFVRVEPKSIHYLRGIATSFLSASELSAEEYRSARVDPIAKFSKPIAAHMNDNHAEETLLIVEKAIGIKVGHAKINDLDRLGLNVQIERNGTLMKLRIPFDKPAEDRKDVKSLIVQMLDNAIPSSDNVSKMRG
eukprot:c27230_g1_i2 orf=113-1150(-)